MRRTLLSTTFIIVFILSGIHLSFAQYYSSSDWMNDKPYQDMISGMSSYSGSSYNTSSSKKKSRNDRDRHSSSSYYYDYSAELRRQAEMKHAAELARREEEFVSEKVELQSSLRGNDYSGSSTGYSSGLRGLSDSGNNNGGNSPYSYGLRGVSDESSSQRGGIDYSTGLRGLSDESSSRYSKEVETQIVEDLRGVLAEERYYSDARARDNARRSVYTTNRESSSIDNNIERKNYYSSRTNGDEFNEARFIYSLSNNVHYIPSHLPIRSTREFTSYIVVNNPQPIYYQGPGSSSFRMGVADDSDESWLDRIEEKIDIWREAGEHKVLTYLGDKLTGFARETVTKSSTVGAWFYKVLDIANEGAGIKNLVVKTAERNIDAIKKSTATMNPRYVNEALKTDKKEIDSYASTTLEKKGLLPPNAKSLDKKAQNVTKDLAETGAVKGFELWLSRRNKQ